LKTEVVLKKEDDATLRALMAVPDLINEDLNFGAMQMLLGRAFVSDVPRTDPSQPMIPIAKHWLATPDRRTFLTEAVEFACIQHLLKGFAQAPAPKSKRSAKLSELASQLPANPKAPDKKQPLLLA